MKKMLTKKSYAFGWHYPEKNSAKTSAGLSEEVVKKISTLKKEPAWMRAFRLQGYQKFLAKKMPTWGGDLSRLNFQNIHYFVRPESAPSKNWQDVSPDIKKTFDRLGIPEAEKKFLAGVGAQYDSETVYHNLSAELKKLGVIYASMDEAVQKYPGLVKKYFGTLIPALDNKFAALNSAVWSGGSFVYVPKGVKVERPLQAYFRINAARMGQFERTLIIIEDEAEAHYIEGCTAPTYSENSLHAAVVEVFVGKNARFRYTTIQNWSDNVFNLVTKRARVETGGSMSWVDGNLGSCLTMKYPSCYLMGRGAHGETLSLAWAGHNQHQDTGAKMIHVAPQTTSQIVAKSVSSDTGRTSYRGLVQIDKSADGARARVQCDALLLGAKAKSDTYPTNIKKNATAIIEHEASVSQLDEKRLAYLQSRGLSESRARSLMVQSFFDPIIRHLPMEYALELKELINLEMEGSVG